MKLAEKALRPILFGAIAIAMTMNSGNATAQQNTSASVPNDVTAIDILLDPDTTMIQHATAPFDDFTFSPAGASVYHLGEYGTAMEKLHSVPLPH